MAKNEKPLKYAPGVEPAPASDESDREFFEALKQPAKIRITTMVDEDIYDALKKLAEAAGHGKYQTVLNQILRNALFDQPLTDRATVQTLLALEKRVKAMEAKLELAERPRKKKAKRPVKRESAGHRAAAR